MQLVVLAEVCATQEKRQLKVCKQLPCAVLVFWMAEADMEIMFFFPFFSPALAEPCFAVHFDETTTVRVQIWTPEPALPTFLMTRGQAPYQQLIASRALGTLSSASAAHFSRTCSADRVFQAHVAAQCAQVLVIFWPKKKEQKC